VKVPLAKPLLNAQSLIPKLALVAQILRCGQDSFVSIKRV